MKSAIVKFKRFLRSQGRLITTQPLSQSVPARSDYAQTEGLEHLGQRVLIRKLYLLINSQLNNLKNCANGKWKKGLWIYDRTSQIGDSLMDLSCRSVLNELGLEIDLLCKENIKDLYYGDSWFHQVFSDPNDCQNQKYDFVIIQSIHQRALRRKIKYFKSLPWVCIQGFYDVPDFARAQFGVERIRDLWSIKHQIADYHAKQKINLEPITVRKDRLRLAFALGGMDKVRTYTKWGEVFGKLQLPATTQITLLGTGEGAASQSIDISTKFSKLNIINKVNKTNLDDVKKILSIQDLLICPDGGLMHLGVACNTTKIVALFINTIPPLYRLPNHYIDASITSNTELVDDIEPTIIGDRINEISVSLVTN